MGNDRPMSPEQHSTRSVGIENHESISDQAVNAYQKYRLMDISLRADKPAPAVEP